MPSNRIYITRGHIIGGYRKQAHSHVTCRAVNQKLETQNQKEDQISIRTTPDNAESEVFSDSGRCGVTLVTKFKVAS